MPPRYLDPNCPVCGETLVLADLLDDPNTDPEEIWGDEWACPKCYDGDSIWIDFDPEEQAEIERRLKGIEDGTIETIPWEDIKKEFDEGLTEEEIKERDERVEKMLEEDMPKTRGILNFNK
ncbi:MAG: addiction module protein [Candidatus Hermodarchaeia archaeon]|jgi:hypothetical protein